MVSYVDVVVRVEESCLFHVVGASLPAPLNQPVRGPASDHHDDDAAARDCNHLCADLCIVVVIGELSADFASDLVNVASNVCRLGEEAIGTKFNCGFDKKLG